MSKSRDISKSLRSLSEEGSTFDNIVREHSHTFSTDYTLDSARNGIVAGPVFIDSGVTITLNDSATLVIA